MTEPATWYTDDIITHVPPRLLWQHARRQGMFWAPQLFLFFWIRRIVGWRFRAAYGIARPERIPSVTEYDVSSDVLEKLAPARQACLDAGMTLCCLTKPTMIGGRSSCSAVFLDHDGRTVATATCLRLTIGRETAEVIGFACQSNTTSGVALDTRPAELTHAYPEMTLPGVESLPLPLEASPAEIIEAHRGRINSRIDVAAFNCDSVGEHGLKEAQRFFDWRIEKGYLVPLTPDEVRRLGGEPA